MDHRKFTISAVAALTLAGSSTAVATAGDYPAKVERTFTHKCVAAAKATSDKGTTKQYRTVCRFTLRCIEGKLTLKEFGKAKASDPAIKSCIRKAKRHFS